MAAPTQQPPPPQWGPPPPVQQTRRWLPAAIIGAAVIIAGAVVAGAVLINAGSNDTAASNTASPSAAAVPTAQVSAADSSTCKGWAAAGAALRSIPALPSGWDWNTPGIDAIITDQSAAIEAALGMFEGDITESDPPQVVAAAREYVAAQRQGMQQRADHTYTGAGAPVTAARVKLDYACGVS